MIIPKSMIKEKGVEGIIQDAFIEAYCKPQGDPHTVFANLLGCTRNEAKTMCYEYIYTPSSNLSAHTHVHFMMRSQRQDTLNIVKGARRYAKDNALRPLTFEELLALGEEGNVH